MEQGPPPIRTKRGSLERMIRDDAAFTAATREFLPGFGSLGVSPKLPNSPQTGSLSRTPQTEWLREVCPAAAPARSRPPTRP
jgi:hypothetical protein